MDERFTAGAGRAAEELPSAMPTEQDRENARIRRAIAERLEAEYAACLALALEAFGPGWFPSCRHSLLEKEEDERRRRPRSWRCCG